MVFVVNFLCFEVSSTGREGKCARLNFASAILAAYARPASKGRGERLAGLPRVDSSDGENILVKNKKKTNNNNNDNINGGRIGTPGPVKRKSGRVKNVINGRTSRAAAVHNLRATVCVCRLIGRKLAFNEHGEGLGGEDRRMFCVSVKGRVTGIITLSYRVSRGDKIKKTSCGKETVTRQQTGHGAHGPARRRLG